MKTIKDLNEKPSNYIRDNYRVFSNLLYNNLDRLPVKDTEASKNFRSIIIDYISFLYDLQYVNVSSNSQLDKQVKYCNQLFTLSDRMKTKSIDEVVPDNIVLSFVEKLQEHMKEWAHDDLGDELKKIEKEHYTNLSFNKESSVGNSNDRIQQLKDEFFNKKKKSF